MSETINKIIKFYNIYLQPGISINGNNIDKLTYNAFQYAFPQIDYYQHGYNDKKYFFEIISYDKNHMFATCAREDNLSNNPFLRQHNLATNQTSPFSLNLKDDEQLESYTFFYVDFSNNKIAIISNQKIPKLDEVLVSFIESKATPHVHIEIAPVIVPNLKKHLKTFQRFKGFEIKFSSDYLNKQYLRSLNSTMSDACKISSGRIKFSVEEHTSSFVDALYNLKSDKNCCDLEVTYKNYEGLDETISLFEQIYTKSIGIVFDKDSTKNLDKIKNILKENLDSHISMS